MFLISRVVAACVCAVTLCLAAPAGAVPLTETETKAKPAATRSVGLPKIERVARTQIGAPYSYGGMTPAGFDCSGFTSWVYSHVGITLPHSSSAQYSLGGSKGFEKVANRSELRVGDLVFHSTGGSGIGHVGIYVGDRQFISATSSEGIQVRSLFDSYWGPLWVGGVRVELQQG